MKNQVPVVLIAVAISVFGCGGAETGGGDSTAKKTPGGGAQIAGGPASGRPRIAGGEDGLAEAEYQLARHAADIVRIMRDHLLDCRRATRVCHAYIEAHRASIENAKARLVAEIDSGPPDRDDEIEEDLRQLLLELEPDAKQIAEDFEDRCRGVADEIGEIFDF
jgi:hypothetical protein